MGFYFKFRLEYFDDQMLFEKKFRNNLEKTKDELASIKKMHIRKYENVLSFQNYLKYFGYFKINSGIFSKGRIIEIYMIIL